MRTQLKLASLLLAGGFFFAACGDGDHNNDGTDTMTTGDQINAAVDSVQNAVVDPNKDFVRDAIELNTKEMAWLDAGMKYGGAEAKGHAKMMMADHEKMGAEILDYAAANGIEPPTVDTTGEVNISDDKGMDWDRKWAEKMVDDHQKVINRFERAQENVTDQALKDMVVKALPALRNHLKMAEGFRDKLAK
jgi:putative membrane protein